MNIAEKNILVTGGASFIGSHLVKGLLDKGCRVKVVDDLSTGLLQNIQQFINEERVEFIQADLREPGVARKVMQGIELVFHLAADHGGRGYIQLNQAATAVNLMLDGLVFWEAHKAGVEKVVFASSGCVYPESLQFNPDEKVYLKEDMIVPPYEADNLYGWAKLMGELTLKAYCQETSMKAASCRYFTAYGPRCLESHAIMAMIGRAYIHQNPFEIWGDGRQIRNWTYVDDIVKGTILAAEKIDDGTAINIGTSERISVLQAANLVMEYTNCKSEIRFLKDMPTGPLNRVADTSLIEQLLGWSPQISFKDGLKRTIDWYLRTKSRVEVEQVLAHKLLER